ncbi:hypothetical protein PAHAL_2G009500 [Panicum hallii]|uniref:Uncharacterized protein n=1 Tax=Panicum hallii TaxID=206008 RepID=A0A2T8KMG9_9POAL|nr:hypothetical protein PAHAL_2G009500 [Panicum hallii]
MGTAQGRTSSAAGNIQFAEAATPAALQSSKATNSEHLQARTNPTCNCECLGTRETGGHTARKLPVSFIIASCTPDKQVLRWGKRGPCAFSLREG